MGNYYYQITFNNSYLVNLIDRDAKILWSKGENGLLYRKYLSGNFILSRTSNETAFDGILSMGYCSKGFLYLMDKNGVEVASSIFTFKDIGVDKDKCQITISPKPYDKYTCILKYADKEYNVLEMNMPKYEVSYQWHDTYEYKSCYHYDWFMGKGYSGIYRIGGEWVGFNEYDNGCPNNGWWATCETQDQTIHPNIYTGWTPYFLSYVFDEGLSSGDEYYFDVTTEYYRAVKLIVKTDNNTPIAPETSDYDWIYDGVVNRNDVEFHKWVKPVNTSYIRQPKIITGDNVVIFRGYPDDTVTRTIERGRKLTDIIGGIVMAEGCVSGWDSEFFKDTENPISLADLSNLILIQKSECKFDGGLQKTNEATVCMLTFNSLMKYLNAMFQVYWYIDDSNILRIEHINYFRNNCSYTTSNSVGIDLNVVYPLCLQGTNSYNFESNIPMREQFKFMEAWNTDFIGGDIEYTDCLEDGGTTTYSADRITTDISPDDLDQFASNDGFCMFHCDDDGNVIEERGLLSLSDLPNTHISWANLHYNYWRYDRPLPTGRMNGKYETFITSKKLKKQTSISFPFCPQNFDPNLLVKTQLGDGEVVSAEYSMKTGQIKVELVYD